MHRLRWLSRSRSASITQTLDRLCTDWRVAWSVRDVADLTWHSVNARDLASHSGWLLVHTAAGQLGLRVDRCTEGALGRQLAKIHDDAESMTSVRIGQAAQQDLAQRILRIDVETMTRTMRRPVELPPDLGDPTRGGGVFRSELGTCGLLLAIDATLADHLAPLPAIPPPPLIRREQALIAQTTRLHLRLDLGELPLRELQQLTEGEVIASHVPMDATFTLALSNTEVPLARARLGRVLEYRAALLNSAVNPIVSTTP